MPAPRFRSRHLHATLYQRLRAELIVLGWIDAPINFGATAVTLVDYVPDERNATVAPNTVAVSLGDYQADEDEELGAKGGGLRSALYMVYVDVYMSEQALSLAITDDVRDVFTDLYIPMVNQITGLDEDDCRIEVEGVIGPERPPNNQGGEQFKRYWRTMRLDCRLYYPS